MNEQHRELRQVIRHKIDPGMTPDQAADAIVGMFFFVEDEWREHDVTTYGSSGQRIQTERWLRASLHRETTIVEKPYPDRSAGWAEGVREPVDGPTDVL